MPCGPRLGVVCRVLITSALRELECSKHNVVVEEPVILKFLPVVLEDL